ncbi:MAG: hypothetical protein IH851_12525 [Armatimonadetes bacterium]|nr:hypothetical protein [Armatimonadota bacterium]
MTKRDVYEVMFRGLALVFAILTIGAFANSLWMVRMQLRFADPIGPGETFYILLPVLARPILFSIFALWLWFAARVIAGRLTPGVLPEPSPSGLTAQELKAVGFAGIGMYFLIAGLVTLGGYVAIILGGEERREVLSWQMSASSTRVPELAGAVLSVVMGVVLLIGPQRVWNGIRRAALTFWQFFWKLPEEDAGGRGDDR